MSTFIVRLSPLRGRRIPPPPRRWVCGREVWVSGAQSHPGGPVLVDLALPDRHLLLEALDGRLAGAEGGGPVRSGARDHDRRLAGQQVTHAVDDGDGGAVLSLDLGCQSE